MNIITIPISEIKPYKNNPRLNDTAVPAVANSIQEFGFRVPLLVDRNNVVIAGHTRLKAALQLGMTDLPCIVADELTPAQVKAYRLMDNKSSEKSHWNEQLLAQEFETLSDSGFDLSQTAFERFEIDTILDRPFDTFDDDPLFDDTTPVDSDSPAPKTDSDRFSVIICCHSDDEKHAIQSILGITGDLRRAYTLKEIVEMRSAATAL